MFYGFNNFIKKILPKRFFYRSLLIVAVPIILLTAKGETHNRIEGLELGADDYLGKPFEPRELLLRIKNILNKVKKPILPEEIYIGKAIINLKKLDIKINDKTIKINPQEKKVLKKMLEFPGKVFTRHDIGKIINVSKERTIDVMITRLRQKIESNPKNPKYLQTIRGSGYVLWIEWFSEKNFTKKIIL